MSAMPLRMPAVIGFVARRFCVALFLCWSVAAEDKFDQEIVGPPIKESLPNGGHKKVYKNAKGERVEEVEFDGSGLPTGAKYINRYHPNGQTAEVDRERYGVDEKGEIYVREVEETDYDKHGQPTYRIVYIYDKNGDELKLRKTTWPPGSGNDGRTTEWKWKEGIDPRTGEKGYWQSDQFKQYWQDAKKRAKEWNRKLGKQGESSYAPATENTAAYFRSGEVQLRAFAIYATGNAQETSSHTVRETRTVVRDRVVERTVLEDIPGIPGLTPVTREIVEPTAVRETVARRETTTNGPYSDHAFGVGVDAKYFVNRHVGLGVEGDWLSASHDAWSVFATVTARYPIEGHWHVAPYLAAGIGGQFADDSRLVGVVAAGAEKRFSPRCGTFLEARYVFDGNEQNVLEARVGLSMTFGHTAETPGTVIQPGRVPDGPIEIDDRPLDDECAALRKKVEAADDAWWDRHQKLEQRDVELAKIDEAMEEAVPELKQAMDKSRAAAARSKSLKAVGEDKAAEDASRESYNAEDKARDIRRNDPRLKKLREDRALAGRRIESAEAAMTAAEKEFTPLRDKYVAKCGGKYRAKVEELRRKEKKEREKEAKKTK